VKKNKNIIEIKEILKSQQNKFPLLFIDKIINCVPGKSVTSIKNFTYNEWFFPAHFEDEPNVPGFIQIEALVQSFIMTFLSMKTYKNNKTNFYNINNAKFRKKIIPGDILIINSKLNSLSRGIATGASEGFVNDEFTCSAEFVVTIPEIFNKFLPKKKI
jgi:3-hydroxyacyl-[acyl-carrier-protein] dehydratase